MSKVSSQSQSEISQVLLSRAYHECCRKGGFINFTKDVREVGGKYRIKLQDIKSLFENSTTWTKYKARNGHFKYRNQITRVVVEFKAHGASGRKTTDVDPGAVTTILDQVQDHLNILCNDVFAYKTRNWKKQPNYKQSLCNYHNMIQPGSSSSA